MADTIRLPDVLSALNNDIDRERLNLAFQSLSKRLSYSEIYYYEFLEKSQAEYLRLATIDQSGNFRAQFEASAVAFISNAHAMIDAFPYVIFLALRPLKHEKLANGILKEVKLGATNCGWDTSFYNSLVYTYPSFKRLAQLFRYLMNDKDFVSLHKISNNSKHKFLSRILNDGKVLKLELLDLDTNKTRKIDIKKFFIRLHNNVLPKVFDIYQELARVSSPGNQSRKTRTYP
ncbi:hypothetical protein NX773_11895 [Massilia solisilvae]|uniref:Uncharacterized protein n=1 Tax=Massilia solisilvae TaxID=1811225 RepID=A0ABT2BK30_9BURK|nr:hypothetical protein [Massilia solisilvae]MCS0608867.1 hypothetical protein [Massilia solisilvae]